MIKTSSLGRGPKKTAKKIGARKITTTTNKDVDDGMESFEKVEERAEAAAQEAEDAQLARKLQATEIANAPAGSSRLAAVYAEAESIYTAPQKEQSSYSMGGSATNNLPYGYQSGQPSSSPRGGNSYSAQNIGTGDAVSAAQMPRVSLAMLISGATKWILARCSPVWMPTGALLQYPQICSTATRMLGRKRKMACRS